MPAPATTPCLSHRLGPTRAGTPLLPQRMLMVQWKSSLKVRSIRHLSSWDAVRPERLCSLSSKVGLSVPAACWHVLKQLAPVQMRKGRHIEHYKNTLVNLPASCMGECLRLQSAILVMFLDSSMPWKRQEAKPCQASSAEVSIYACRPSIFCVVAVLGLDEFYAQVRI